MQISPLVRAPGPRHIDIDVVADDGEQQFDDIVVLSNDPELIESAFARLAKGGIFNVTTAEPVSRGVSLDVGRMHYDHLLTVGTTGNKIWRGIWPRAQPAQVGRR